MYILLYSLLLIYCLIGLGMSFVIYALVHNQELRDKFLEDNPHLRVYVDSIMVNHQITILTMFLLGPAQLLLHFLGINKYDR